MKVPRGKPKIWTRKGIKYLQLVTKFKGEETTDYFSFDEIEKIIGDYK